MHKTSVFALIFLLFSCSEDTGFKGNEAIEEKIEMKPSEAISVDQKGIKAPETVEGKGAEIFELSLNDGVNLARAETLKAQTRILEGPGGKSLATQELSKWQVSFTLNNSTETNSTSFGPFAIGDHELDFATYHRQTSVKAVFENTESNRTYTLSQAIFIDRDAPFVSFSYNLPQDFNRDSLDSVSIINLPLSASWRDDHFVDLESLTIYGCSALDDNLGAPKTQMETEEVEMGLASINDLDSSTTSGLSKEDLASCTVLLKGKEISQNANAIDLASLASSENLDTMTFYFSAEDQVGRWSATALKESSNDFSTTNQLQISFVESSTALGPYPAISTNHLFTKLIDQNFVMKVSYADAEGNSTELSVDSPDLKWEVFLSLGSSSERQMSAVIADDHSLSFPLQGIDSGTNYLEFDVYLSATHTNGSVATTKLPLIFDNEPPIINEVSVSVDGNILKNESKVVVDWMIEDNFRAGEQVKEIIFEVKTESGEWIVVDTKTDFKGVSSSITWKEEWGSGPIEIRLKAIDYSGNESEYAAGEWAAQPFNAAVVLTSVKCVFCHLKIEGDLGGINFPTSLHAAAGYGLLVEGRIYSSNAVPKINNFDKRALFGAIENYSNEEEKIFPKNSNGKIDFPDISITELKTKAKGLLTYKRGGKSLFVNRVHEGNLFVDGEDIQIQGEVVIDGDLIIKGKYSGQGTIYARKVFIPDDLIAKGNSPFPFHEEDLSNYESKALAKARDSIARGDHSLYLAAIGSEQSKYDGQIIVGDPKANAQTDHDTPIDLLRPYPSIENNDEPVTFSGIDTPLTRDLYLALGTKSVAFKDNDGNTLDKEALREKADGGKESNFTPAQGSYVIDVARVDSYFYASRALVWRSFDAFLLNGGFMAPNVFMTSKAQHATGNWWKNNRNEVGFNTGLEINDRLGFPWMTEVSAINPTLNAMIVRKNPRNGVESHTNVIRYDYRLRAGGQGFESLRSFFK